MAAVGKSQLWMISGKQSRFLRSDFVRLVSSLHTTGSHNNQQSSPARNDTTTKEINIPRRIKREPTDLLKALARTVSRDYTAAHYRYHDDPGLIPVTSMGKKICALSKESGRKAARFMVQKHPNLFQHRIADPPIQEYSPQVSNTEGQLTEKNLVDMIEKAQVQESMKLYEMLQQKEIKVSPGTKQSLLELVCFYNEQEATNEDLLDDRWFQLGQAVRDRIQNTWQKNGFAHKLFNSMEVKDALAYCAMIRGMNKFYNVNDAWELYQEMLQKDLPVDRDTYNSIIKVTGYLMEGYSRKWDLAMDLLKRMKADGLEPNILTLNAVLEVLSSMPYYNRCRVHAMSTISEFKQLGIEPSLRSYCLLLNIFCKERGQKSTLLVDIMDYIENKEFTIQDPKDTYFFVTAMMICLEHLLDKDLAYRVDKLLNTGNHHHMIGDNMKESVYYRHFLKLLCMTEHIDTLMETYDKLVPNVYTPEHSVTEEIIKAVDISGATSYLPRIWSDIVTFLNFYNEEVLECLLTTMMQNPPPADSPLVHQFCVIAWDIWEKIEKSEIPKAKNVSLTGAMLGNMMSLCLQDGNFSKACSILDKLKKEQDNVAGVPSADDLHSFLQKCCDLKNSNEAISLIRYAVELGYSEAVSFAEELNNILPLDSIEKQKLTHIFGMDILSEKQSSQQTS